MARTTASTALTHSDTYESGSEGGEGGGGLLGLLGDRLGRLGPENNFSRPCELQFGQTIKRGWEGAGGRGGPDLFLRSATIHNIHHLQRIFLCNRR